MTTSIAVAVCPTGHALVLSFSFQVALAVLERRKLDLRITRSLGSVVFRGASTPDPHNRLTAAEDQTGRGCHDVAVKKNG